MEADAVKTDAGDPQVLWEPSAQLREGCRLSAFVEAAGVQAADYAELWQWSVDSLEDFWRAVWDHFEVAPGTSYDAVLGSREMPGTTWFPGAQVSFPERLLRAGTGRDRETALVAVGEDGTSYDVSWAELTDQVGAVAAGLRALGVQRGDRVVGYLPNVPQAIIAFLATASLGAVWSACAPDIGPRSAADRFAQLEPVVLLAADGYRYGGREFDRRAAVGELLEALPTVRHVVQVPMLGLDHPQATTSWQELLATPDRLAPEPVPFDAPLWVVFSSGTTGLPKGLVHSHGGALLMGLAQLALQADVGPEGRVSWFTSTTWIMWNYLVSALLAGATVVLYDGSPLHPTPDRLWQLAADQRLTSLGTSPGYLLACAKADLHPGRDHDLSALRALGVTGSPLPASSYRWVYEEVGPLWLQVLSGGTDFAGAIVGPSPWLPVWEGEMSGRYLGCAVQAWDQEGRPLVDQVGELVITEPLPSMPLQVWGDESGERYRSTYFDVYPGVWRHGDWLTITRRGSAVIAGRSDSTLNRGGVRMGSADIYQAVEALPEVAEALVLGVEQPDGGYWLPLFVRLAEGCALDDALVQRIRAAVRAEASPRHVPDEVLEVPAVPHTATGKKLEVPLKRLFQGVPVEQACNLGAVDDPQAVLWFADLAAQRR